MKQIVSTYSYSPTTNVVTLSGLNIDADQLLLIVAPQVGRTMYNFASVTGSVVAGVDTRVTLNASTAGLTTTSPLVIFYDDQASAQSVTGTVALDPASLLALENVTVTVGSSVSISNFPASQTVAGTVTANFGNPSDIIGGGYPNLFAFLDDTAPNVTINGAPSVDGTLPISGTVTLSEFVSVESSQERLIGSTGGNPLNAGVGISFNLGGASSIVGTSNPLPISGTVTVGNSVTIGSLPVSLSTTTIGGTARLNVTLSSATTLGATVPSYGNLYGGSDGTNFRAINVDSSGRTVVTGSVSVGSLPAISGTVTVGTMPSGALTTRFGSVATANTAQLTSAVTNASRKYLLVQNIATSTVTIGIGFAPTTTQGIQLTAGAGLTFDAFCPTGGVWWLSGVTSSNFCVIEG
jgi:hypothetical protein